MNPKNEEDNKVKLTILYDNHPSPSSRLKADWGFSCLIQGLEKTILFDTGANGSILQENMSHLEVSPTAIDFVFLSHFHHDHTGGLEKLINLNPHLEILLPASFPSTFKNSLRAKNILIREITSFQEICPQAYSTGIIEGWIKEQSLVLEVPSGLILMTGCAHPRIVNIISLVKQFFPKEITLLIGGFHLAGFSSREILQIIQVFRLQEVKRVAPAHCTGDEASSLLQQEYQENFLDVTVGKGFEIQ
ncbi:MAG TPA: MBL fold metallo-hydrolase [Candidatus Aminicenantes bacterium]|nr:MBL fold metallo-hydrolase [Candidatus Aminicenantes bacterium]